MCGASSETLNLEAGSQPGTYECGESHHCSLKGIDLALQTSWGQIQVSYASGG